MPVSGTMFLFTSVVPTSDIVPSHSKDMSLILEGVKVVCYILFNDLKIIFQLADVQFKLVNFLFVISTHVTIKAASIRIVVKSMSKCEPKQSKIFCLLNNL
jgi:hypothetical protein